MEVSSQLPNGLKQNCFGLAYSADKSITPMLYTREQKTQFNAWATLEAIQDLYASRQKTGILTPEMPLCSRYVKENFNLLQFGNHTLGTAIWMNKAFLNIAW